MPDRKLSKENDIGKKFTVQTLSSVFFHKFFDIYLHLFSVRIPLSPQIFDVDLKYYMYEVLYIQ